jgi:hypothetical protein
MTTSKTTVWAVLAGAAVAFEVDRTTRPEIETGLVAAGCSPFAPAWYVTESSYERIGWGLSQDGSESHVVWREVPVEVREACALWLPGWAGRSCAQSWHDEAPAVTRPAGLTCERFASDLGGLPSDDDVNWLRDACWRLLGREPSETERRSFGRALLKRLFELTPVASSDGEEAP